MAAALAWIATAEGQAGGWAPQELFLVLVHSPRAPGSKAAFFWGASFHSAGHRLDPMAGLLLPLQRLLGQMAILASLLGCCPGLVCHLPDPSYVTAWMAVIPAHWT